MADTTPNRAPQSPEVEPPAVREQLQQENITHEGQEELARAKPTGDAHLGADERQMTPILAPMRGPDNLVGSDGGTGSDASDGEELIDPADEITPG